MAIEIDSGMQSGTRWQNSFDDFGIVGFSESSCVQKKLNFRLVDCEFKFPRFERRIDVDKNRTNSSGGILNYYPLVPVWSPDANTVASGYPEIHQRFCELGCEVPEFSIGCSETL